MRAADAVRIGLDNPLTGTYAGPGKNELIGCQMALDEINAKGGILGRMTRASPSDSPLARGDTRDALRCGVLHLGCGRKRAPRY
jgi:Periplasmic binding protein